MQTHRWVDFYAKALALVGLSGLAATGALIDNWPTPASIPEVELAERWFGVPIVQTIVEIPSLPPSPVTLRPVMARPASRSYEGQIVHPRWVASFRPVAARRGEADDLVAVALPVPAAFGVPELPAFELSEPPEVELVETWQPMSAPAMTMARSDEGFFSGALKKTSSSLGASIDKARTSLVDAVRAVSGAVKRAF